jgi:hypothetical protein
MSTMPPGMPPVGGAPAANKTSPLVWILGGLGVFFVLCMVTCGVVAYVGMHALKNAGFDADMMQKNPGLAMTKMVTAFNPNLQVVSTNDRAGTVTVRDKTTGKTVTYKFDPDKKSMVITGQDGAQVSFGADSATKMPAWVPAYPGASIEGALSAQDADARTGSFSFKTSDATSKVTSYYEDQLKAAGFNVTLISTNAQGGMVSAEDAGKKRTVIVIVGESGGTTTGSITVSEKK